jgi:hypothetical protein
MVVMVVMASIFFTMVSKNSYLFLSNVQGNFLTL